MGLYTICSGPFSAIAAGTYTDSAHGNSSTGVDRDVVVLGTNRMTELADYAVGNCAHCHEQHASIGKDEPTASSADETAAGANPFTLFNDNYDDAAAANTNSLCYYCHEKFNTTGVGDYNFYRAKTNYRGSAHSSDGVGGSMASGETSPVSFPPGPAKADPGNCNNCHNPHGYDDDAGAPWTEPVPFMLIGREGLLCIGCHKSGGVGADVATDVQKTHDAASSVHKAADATLATDDYKEVHDLTSEYNTAITTKHVECVDCHNPHTATSSLHTQGTNNVSGVLAGVVGIAATTPATWTEPTYSVVQTATDEYQICYKCHSGANTAAAGFADWGGGSGSTAWTDVGLEFNTNNASYHPVVGITDATARISGLTGDWTAGVGQTMYCSDCHESDSLVAGPHGSATKWMLSGDNKAWPYLAADRNGTADTSGFRTYTNREDDLGFTDGLFCRNCHTVGTAVHNSDSDHRSIACVNCHIRVPHGGKLARFISTDTAGLPARYHPNGNNGGFSGGRPTSYTNYGTSEGSCRVTGCGEHSSGTDLSEW